MAKIKVINTALDENLNGQNFTNVTSQTIFSFGNFTVTSNFDGQHVKDFSGSISSFSRPVTLETLALTTTQAQIINDYNTNAVLNLDKSDLNTFVKFGSAYEFLRITIENIIVNYPASLFMSSQISRSGNITYVDYVYDTVTNTSTFRIPINCIVNTFGLVYNDGNTSEPDNRVLRNLNLSYDKYNIWTYQAPNNNSSAIIGFTGSTTKNPSVANYRCLIIKAIGNPFSFISGTTSSTVDFHIKPNSYTFEEFRSTLSEYERYIVSQRDNMSGFKFTIKDPTLLDNGNIIYSDTNQLWTTGDKYNIDISSSNYQKFLEILLTIGAKYDKIKTDLISRFLTPSSIKTYDLTENGKITKLLRIYGWEFDKMREFIDALVFINRVTYDKINNAPDQLIKNLSKTFGWDYLSLVNESELVQSFLTIDDDERNLNNDLMPAEIDIELWRRIIMNTNYFWKSKGTRESIKAMFLLIGIPEPFINITEYVYTVEGKINPNTVPLLQSDFPTNSLPYDAGGYPVAPLETPDFYFQVSGDTDSGQAYMDVFRSAGFNLMRTVDNKKSWIQTGSTYRIDDTTPQYYQEDSKLVVNTKEVDISLDTSRGIEYDVYEYIKRDFAINSSGYTLPFSYVNISLGFTGSENTFTLPYNTDKIEGDFEVRYNGILLNAPKSGNTSQLLDADYSVSGNSFTILNGNYAINSGNRRDIIQATFVYSGGTHSVSGITTEYVVTRVKANPSGTVIPLPSYPRGDVQVTINGIALTKGTAQFSADYIVDPNNTTGSSQIIIQNPDVIAFLQGNPSVQVAYIEVIGSNDISVRSEVWRVDSFNTSKIYYSSSAGRYVYRLDYRANNSSDVKVLINGIALEPYTDYSVNIMNPYEIFLPIGIKYGTIINVYYLIGGNTVFNPVIQDIFGVGDISTLSFLEFLELVQRKMINAKNRKIISDFSGGWYPALLNVYVEYLKRSTLPINDPLVSNGYTFQNLYSFLNKYNAFFQKFIDQLLSATIILRKSGILIRNTVFTKQKFEYKRGVNLYSGGSTTIDTRGNNIIQYLGDDGAIFMIQQKQLTVPPDPQPTLFVETRVGSIGSIITGGVNIIGNNLLTSYGVDYRKWNGLSWDAWVRLSTSGSLLVDNFSTTINPVDNNTLYQYRAFIQSTIYGYTGNTLEITTPAIVVTPVIHTRVGAGAANSINNTGGFNIIGWESIEYYAMEYKRSVDSSWTTFPVLPVVGPILANSFSFSITGLITNTSYDYRAYMIVGGTPYYGEIQTTSTFLTLSAPIVTTGSGFDFTEHSIMSCNNTVDNNGNTTITEYGVLYTADGAYATNATLVCTNYPTHVLKKSITNDINVGKTFFTGTTCVLNGLMPYSQTYFRAFATNSVGIGYGAITNNITLPAAEEVSLCRTYGSDVLSPDGYSSGIITLNPALYGVGQCLNVNFNVKHLNQCSSSPYTGQHQTYIYCRPNGTPTYNLVCSYSTSAPTVPYIRNCNWNGSVTMCYGDSVCYINKLSSTACCSSCVDLTLTAPTSSPNINPTNSLTYYRDCIKTNV